MIRLDNIGYRTTNKRHRIYKIGREVAMTEQIEYPRPKTNLSHYFSQESIIAVIMVLTFKRVKIVLYDIFTFSTNSPCIAGLKVFLDPS